MICFIDTIFKMMLMELRTILCHCLLRSIFAGKKTLRQNIRIRQQVSNIGENIKILENIIMPLWQKSSNAWKRNTELFFLCRWSEQHIHIIYTGCFVTGPALNVLSMELVPPNKEIDWFCPTHWKQQSLKLIHLIKIIKIY